MWTLIEMGVAIICACLPQIRPLVVKLFPRLMPAYYNSRDRSVRKHTLGSSLMKPSSSRRAPASEEGRWSRIECQDGINLTSIRKGDGISDVPSLHENGSGSSKGIQKTVQYSVEYSRYGKGSEV